MLYYNRLKNIKWMIWKQQVYYKIYIKIQPGGQVSLVSTHDVTNPPVHYCNWSLAYFGSKVLTIFTNKLWSLGQ